MAFESLYKEIFGEATDLKRVTGIYPYFIPAHFFRLQQSNPGEAGYNDIAAKTALHFANPWLLNQQLNAEETIADKIVVSPLETVQAENIPDLENEEIQEDSFEHRVEVVEEEIVAGEPVVVDEVIKNEPGNSIKDDIEKETVVAEVKNEGHPPLLFEPLHTTDYFASQGIKLSEVALSGDKMGKQLKSFTDWLKTMKKVHPAGLKERSANDNTVDSSVQKLAEKSNREEEVLTESMAAVYIRQGRTNKAKEIYEKLSLLNPAKSAYFAAKLNEIQ
jgi:hypothetical protein